MRHIWEDEIDPNITCLQFFSKWSLLSPVKSIIREGSKRERNKYNLYWGQDKVLILYNFFNEGR